MLTGSANPLLVPNLGDGLIGRMGICIVAARVAEERRKWCNDYLFNALQKDINELSKIEHFSQMPSLLYGIANRIGSPLNVNSLTDIRGP